MRLTGPSEVCTVVYAMDTVIHIRLSAGAMAALDEKARVEGRSRNWVARRILEGGLSNGVFGRTGGSGIQISEQWASGAQSSAGRDARTAGRVRAVRTEDSEDDNDGSVPSGHERGGVVRDRVEETGGSRREKAAGRKPRVHGTPNGGDSQSDAQQSGSSPDRPTNTEPRVCMVCDGVGRHSVNCPEWRREWEEAQKAKPTVARAGRGVSVAAKGGPVERPKCMMHRIPQKGCEWCWL